MQKTLQKYPYLQLKRGWGMDTIIINEKKTGLELSREDKKIAMKNIYDEIIDTEGYMSIELMGTMIVLKKW